MSLVNFRQVLRARAHIACLGTMGGSPARDRGHFESNRIVAKDRFEDEPAPTDDDMISKHINSRELRLKLLDTAYRGALLETSPNV